MRHAAFNAGVALCETDAIPDALGVGIERAQRNGQTLGYYTLTVFVQRKLEEPCAAVREVEFTLEGVAMSVVPNIIALGNPPTPDNGQRHVFTGIHVGGTIRLDGVPTPYSGIGALYSLDGAVATHLVTAGHTFPPAASGFPVWCAATPNGQAGVVGYLTRNFLEQPSGIDAALVTLNGLGAAMSQLPRRGPKLARVSALQAGANTRGRVFRPTTYDWSPSVNIRREPAFWAPVLSANRPQPYVVRDVLQSEGVVTTGGDSGAALVLSADSDAAIGTVIGRFGGRSLFQRFQSTHEAVKQTLGGGDLWAAS